MLARVAVLSSVALGFAFLLFKIDEFEDYLLKGLDMVESKMKGE